MNDAFAYAPPEFATAYPELALRNAAFAYMPAVLAADNACVPIAEVPS